VHDALTKLRQIAAGLNFFGYGPGSDLLT